MHTDSAVRENATASTPQSSASAGFQRSTAAEAIAFYKLSPRELDVIHGYMRGIGAKKIAERAGIAVKTVHTYRARIFEKLPIKNTTQLGIWAERVGLAAAAGIELDGK